MDQILAVLDRERQFSERFCSYVNKKERLPLRAAAFHSYGDYCAFAASHKVQVLLAEAELIAGEYELSADTVFCLREGREAQAERPFVSCDGEISRFQAGEEILRQVMAALSERSGGLFLSGGERTTRVVCVYSPVGRCRKTAFALLYAISSARKGRVLYLNLEVFSGLSDFLTRFSSGSLSDALYYYKQDALDAAKFRSLLEEVRGVELLSPWRSAEDMLSASGEDVAGLIALILKEMCYDLIILDPGPFSSISSPLLDLSDEIFMPVPEDPVSRAKAAEFEQYLNQAERRLTAKKLRRLLLPEEGTERLKGGGFGSDPLDALLLSPLGDFVRELIL